jgi:hypothetical protein
MPIGSPADPCRYANDGVCDVPTYCSEGDWVDCHGPFRRDEKINFEEEYQQFSRFIQSMKSFESKGKK